MVREREMKNTDKDVSMCPELALTVLLGLTFIHNCTLMCTGLGSVKCFLVFIQVSYAQQCSIYLIKNSNIVQFYYNLK